MERKSHNLVQIEFFQAKDCPYCPTVRKMLLELIDSELGKHVIIAEIDINSPIGRELAKHYQLKGVPSIAMNGKLKFAGVPHPLLFLNEIKRLLKDNKRPKPKLQNHDYIKRSELPKKDDTELSFYT
ncbi:MAG: thioredoxin family protein [Candidatus Helarchaeota archaeon]|nr:thioredoxin family protein [Candidatus Helarchaeota archaeon]